MINAKELKYWIIGVIIVLIVVALLIFRPTFSRRTPYDIQRLNGITLSKISLNRDENITTYSATVKADKDMNINYIIITLVKDGKEVNVTGYVGKELKKGDETTISASTTEDMTNVDNIKYEIIEK